jgi:hypothetical protein
MKKKMHKKPGSKPPKRKVTFVFDDDATADHFLSWLCGSGEQQYWQWMEYRESEENGNITVTNFDYWGGKKKGKFGAGDIICPSGRLTDEFDDEEDNDTEEIDDEDS